MILKATVPAAAWAGRVRKRELETTAGMSADYVYQETKRAVSDVDGKCKIYPGIDLDIPTDASQKKTTPEDVYAATAAGLKAGAAGVLFSRKYSEMKLANLAAGGKAVREFQG